MCALVSRAHRDALRATHICSFMSVSFLLQAFCGCKFVAPVFLRESTKKTGATNLQPFFRWCKYMVPVFLEELAVGTNLWSTLYR